MKNCIVKSYGLDFDNENLPRYATFSFDIKNAPAGWLMSLRMKNGTGEVSYGTGGYVTTGAGSNTKLADTATINTSNTNVYSCSGSYKSFFYDNYQARQINMVFTDNNLTFDFTPLQYRENLDYVRLVNSSSSKEQGNISGDIVNLASLVNLTFIQMNGSYNIIGDIAELKDLVSAENINLNLTNVEGTYESLLSAMCANRTSGTMNLDCRNTNVKFHNVNVSTVRHTIVFSATGCEVQPYEGGTAIATYTKANNTWVYA